MTGAQHASAGGRNRSRQARALRRKLTLHTAITWAVYSIVFVISALALNEFVVPRVADYVIDRTATTLYYDPQDYLESYSTQQLLNQYQQRLDDDNIEFGIEIFDDLPDEISASAEDAAEATDIAMLSDETGAESYADRPIGLVTIIHESGTDLDTAQETKLITPYYLAYQAAESAFAEVSNQGGQWQVLYMDSSREDGLGPFQAREISFYNAVKQLKVPIVAVLYLFGCLVIIMMEMRRAMGYFDQLAGAVAGLLADRSKPVQLSPELSLAQNELNDIRLEALNDERVAKSAEMRKNELVAYLAHDIRTPLTSIIGYLSLLDESPDLPEEQRRRFIHTAFAKAEGLEGLINEFFEITRYNLQNIPIERSWIDARIMLQQMSDEFLPQASSRSVGIQVSAPEGALLYADASKLARALENVLRNAIAYADEGTEVMVTAEMVKEPADITASTDGIACRTAPAPGPSGADASTSHDSWRITITNIGREISPAHLESIFEKFYREDAARSAGGGAGLGLAIAKEIVVAHGGTIAASSADGKTTFTIALPDKA